MATPYPTRTGTSTLTRRYRCSATAAGPSTAIWRVRRAIDTAIVSIIATYTPPNASHRNALIVPGPSSASPRNVYTRSAVASRMANGPTATSAPPGSDVSRAASEATRTAEGAPAYARAFRCANNHAPTATTVLPATTPIISHAPRPEPG